MRYGPTNVSRSGVRRRRRDALFRDAQSFVRAETSRDRLERRRRRSGFRARLEATHELEKMVLRVHVLVARIEVEWNPDLAMTHETFMASRHDADDGARLGPRSAERELAAHDVGGAPEPGLPGTVAQQRHRLGPGHRVGFDERTTQGRGRSEEREVTRRHSRPVQLHCATGRLHQRETGGTVSRRAADTLDAAFELLEQLTAETMLAPYAVEALRVVVRQVRKQHSVDDTEDRHVGTDSEGQCQNRHESETWLASQHANCIAQVLNHPRQEARPDIPPRVGARQRRAEAQPQATRGDVDEIAGPPRSGAQLPSRGLAQALRPRQRQVVAVAVEEPARVGGADRPRKVER